jgi:hypothetical protein
MAIEHDRIVRCDLAVKRACLTTKDCHEIIPRASHSVLQSNGQRGTCFACIFGLHLWLLTRHFIYL